MLAVCGLLAVPTAVDPARVLAGPTHLTGLALIVAALWWGTSRLPRAGRGPWLLLSAAAICWLSGDIALLFHLVGLPWLAFGMVRAQQIPILLAVVASIGTGCAFFGSGTRLETVGWVVLGLAVVGIGSTIARPGSWSGSRLRPRAASLA